MGRWRRRWRGPLIDDPGVLRRRLSPSPCHEREKERKSLLHSSPPRSTGPLRISGIRRRHRYRGSWRKLPLIAAFRRDNHTPLGRRGSYHHHSRRRSRVNHHAAGKRVALRLRFNRTPRRWRRSSGLPLSLPLRRNPHTRASVNHHRRRCRVARSPRRRQSGIGGSRSGPIAPVNRRRGSGKVAHIARWRRRGRKGIARVARSGPRGRSFCRGSPLRTPLKRRRPNLRRISIRPCGIPISLSRLISTGSLRRSLYRRNPVATSKPPRHRRTNPPSLSLFFRGGAEEKGEGEEPPHDKEEPESPLSLVRDISRGVLTGEEAA